MHNAELHVKLPPDLPSESYEGIRQAVSSLLELWGVPDAGAQLISAEADSEAIGRIGTGE
ncbi:hypothetical protein AB0I60_32455 [Actinosynnema sp. NPDC050436]|uniref:hypothetical protein n=1 Tax=Actinosynnema sp. NPDC050436 TaxID=3155659 RepID=UPI0033EBE245